MAKRFLFLLRRGPYDGLWAREGLDMVLTAAAFDQQVSVLFLDDGVFQLLSGQSPGEGQKPVASLFGALSLYDVEAVFVERESLEERGVAAEQLVVPVQIVARGDVGTLLDGQDLLVSC